jgi:hypothetical protein
MMVNFLLSLCSRHEPQWPEHIAISFKATIRTALEILSSRGLQLSAAGIALQQRIFNAVSTAQGSW